MRKIIDSILKSITEFFSKLGKKEKIRLAVFAALIIVLAIVVAVILGRTTYGTLYSGLDAATAGSVIAELDTMGVQYKTPSTGTIMIPEDDITRVKMQLATTGLFPSGFDYSIFSEASGFGTTDLQMQTQLVFQTESNIRQQLLVMDKISDALVQLKLDEGSSFVLSAKEETMSASVTLTLKAGTSLTDSEVEAIAYLVSGPTGIPVENVYIVDNNSKFYTVGGDNFSGATDLAYQLELEAQVRARLETQVENLLTTVFGEGKVKTSVAVELNFDKESVQSVVFAPPVEGSEEGIAVSMSEIYEYTRDATAEGVPGTDTNGVGTLPEYPYDDDNEYAYRYIAREFNYEINETVTQLEKAQATIKNLSIAVLLDSEALDTDYTENVRSLVVNAIGVGDNYVTVERLPFLADASDISDATSEYDKYQRRQFILEIIKVVVKLLAIVLLGLAILGFLRTLIKGLTKQPEPAFAAAGMPVDPIGGSVDYITEDESDELEQSMYEDINLDTKSEGVAKLEQFIDKDSNAIAQLLRNWLTEEE